MKDKMKSCPIEEDILQITETMPFLESYKIISQYYGVDVPENIEEILMVLASLLMYVWQEGEITK